MSQDNIQHTYSVQTGRSASKHCVHVFTEIHKNAAHICNMIYIAISLTKIIMLYMLSLTNINILIIHVVQKKSGYNKNDLNVKLLKNSDSILKCSTNNKLLSL